MNKINIVSRTSFWPKIAENIGALKDKGEKYGIWRIPLCGASDSAAISERFREVDDAWQGWSGTSGSAAISETFNKVIDTWLTRSGTSGLTATSERLFFLKTFKRHQLRERVTSAVPNIISENWSRFATTRLTNKAFLYLSKLANKKNGWRGPGSFAMNTKSLESFLDFWNQLLEFAQEPEFVLMPNGNLQAEWYENNEHFVELEFQQDGKIIFGIFDGETVVEGATCAEGVAVFLKQVNFKQFKRFCKAA